MEISGQFHTLAALTPGKEPPVLTEHSQKCLGGSESQFGLCGGEKTTFPLPGFELRFFQTVDYTLCRLRYPKRELNVHRFHLFPCEMH